MTRKIEKTFTVAVPVERAWEAFADSHERSQWEAAEFVIDPRPGGAVRWVLPGIETTGRVEEVDLEYVRDGERRHGAGDLAGASF